MLECKKMWYLKYSLMANALEIIQQTYKAENILDEKINIVVVSKSVCFKKK